MGMKIWWVTSIVWLFIFGALGIFISVRDVDGAGMVQTPEIRLITFGILGIAFLFVALVQLVFLYAVRKSTKNNTTANS